MNLFNYFRFTIPHPIFESHPGKTPEIIITGGMDGDEKAGIEACQQLIKRFKNHSPSIPLIIIPILNQAGHDANLSQNPYDGHFPKYIYPGTNWGSSTYRLMHWLHTHYTSKTKLWIDLHSGDKNEELTPFVWVSQANIQILRLLSGVNLPILNTLKKSLSPNLPYIMIEAGSFGQADPDSVTIHLDTINTIIAEYQNPSGKIASPTYNQIQFIKPGDMIKGDILWQSKQLIAIASTKS